MNPKDKRKMKWAIRRGWLKPSGMRAALLILGYSIGAKVRWVVKQTIGRGKEEWYVDILKDRVIRNLAGISVAGLLAAVLWFLFR